MNEQDILTRSNFSMLEGKIDDRIILALKAMGYNKPTQIQAKCLPQLLLGYDVIGAAKTGSGKTLAFLIPMIEKLIKLQFTQKQDTGCIIISPTRELALQTYEVLKKLLVKINLSHSIIVGGEKKNKEITKLHKGVNIIVSTPGRLLDHLQNTEGFSCENLKCLVLDEADKLLEAGFEKHITGIISLLPSNRQTILFSATIDDNVKNLARLTLKKNPVLITVKDKVQSTVTGLQQGYFICPVEKRVCWLYKMLKKCKKMKVMVFFSSCNSVDFHYEFFKGHCKADIISIHGKQSQPKRKEAFQSFVEAERGALFCTDVAARGLDIPKVDWIVQFDPPSDVKEYIHRVGRTARGLIANGRAVILLRPEEEDFITFLKREKVYLDKYNFEEPSEEIQKMLEDVIQTNGVMKVSARKAYLSFLRCYKKHQFRKVFDIKKLDLKLAAKAFGFLEQPHVDFWMYNRNNNHYWSTENPLRTTESSNQIRFSFNCWCGIKDNKIVSIQFYDGTLRGQTYLNILRNLDDDLDELPLAEIRNIRFQQDGAPAHNSRLAQNYLNERFGNTWIGTYGEVQWPARSPDLTPMDFFLWGHLKNEVYKSHYDTVDDLKISVRQTLNTIPHISLRNATRSVLRRSRLCLGESGGHFEQFIR